MNSKYLARKFLLTVIVIFIGTILLIFKHLSDTSYIELILGILAFYHGADSIQNHKSFKQENTIA